MRAVELTSIFAPVWLHQSWSTEAALLSVVFDLIGGGDSIRITMACACIANITPAENLWVQLLAFSYRAVG